MDLQGEFIHSSETCRVESRRTVNRELRNSRRNCLRGRMELQESERRLFLANASWSGNGFQGLYLQTLG